MARIFDCILNYSEFASGIVGSLSMDNEGRAEQDLDKFVQEEMDNIKLKIGRASCRERV